MTLRPGETPGRAIAVFPFLKTSDPVRLGNFTFRSTDDKTDLSAQDSRALRTLQHSEWRHDNLKQGSAPLAEEL